MIYYLYLSIPEATVESNQCNMEPVVSSQRLRDPAVPQVHYMGCFHTVTLEGDTLVCISSPENGAWMYCTDQSDRHLSAAFMI